MTYSFKTIDATDAPVMFAAFEGDNEIAVIDAGSNGDEDYMVLVVNHGADEPHELVRESFNTLKAAIERVAEFLRCEYEAAY